MTPYTLRLLAPLNKDDKDVLVCLYNVPFIPLVLCGVDLCTLALYIRLKTKKIERFLRRE